MVLTTSGKLPIKTPIAGVVKLVDALDSKSSGLYVHAGSIPAPGTTRAKGLADSSQPFFCSAAPAATSQAPAVAHCISCCVTATAPGASAHSEMRAYSGLDCSLEVAAFKPFHDFPDGALLHSKYVDADGRKGLNGIGPDMTGEHRTHIFISQKLSGLDSGPAAPGGALVVESFVAHIRQINDQKIGAAAKSRIERRI